MKHLLKKLIITTIPITTVVATSVAAMSCGGNIDNTTNHPKSENTYYIKSARDTVLRNILAPEKGKYLNNIVNYHSFEIADVQAVKSNSKLVKTILFDKSKPLVDENNNINDGVCSLNFNDLEKAIDKNKSYYLNITNKLDIKLFENNSIGNSSSTKSDLEKAMNNVKTLISNTTFPHEDLDIDPLKNGEYFSGDKDSSNFSRLSIRPSNTTDAFYPLFLNDIILDDDLEFAFGYLYHFIYTSPRYSDRTTSAKIETEFQKQNVDFSYWYANGYSDGRSDKTRKLPVFETTKSIITMKMSPSIQYDEQDKKWVMNLKVNLYSYNKGEGNPFVDKATSLGVYDSEVVKTNPIPLSSDFINWDNAISKDFKLDIFSNSKSSPSDVDKTGFKKSLPKFAKLIENMTKTNALKSLIDMADGFDDNSISIFMNSGIQGTIDISKQKETLIDKNTKLTEDEKDKAKDERRNNLITKLVTNLKDANYQQKVLDASMVNKVDIKSFANMINSLAQKPYNPSFDLTTSNNVAMSMLYQIIEILDSINQIKG